MKASAALTCSSAHAPDRSATRRERTVSLACRLRIIQMILFAAVLAFAGGCDKQAQNANANGAQPVEHTVERGPVMLTVRVARGTFTVGEKVALAIEATAEPGVEVRMPALEGQLGPFEISDPHRPPDIPDGGKRRWTHTYMLRTLESGELELPTITATFIDRRESAAAGSADEGEKIEEREIASGPLTLTVQSVLTGEVDPTQFRDIKSAVEVSTPGDVNVWLYAGLGAIALSLILAAWLWLRRKRGEEQTVVPEPEPHVWALQQLEALAAEQLVQRGEFHPYYFRLSAIVRQYIERRFGIMAAEQTTEEFLREAGRSTVLDEAQRVLLSNFLRLADMVKFAKFQPTVADSDEAFAAAKDFVQQTAEESSGTRQAARAPDVHHSKPAIAQT